MARFRDSAEFAPTVDAAAARLGISPAAVEKEPFTKLIEEFIADLG